MTHAHDDGERCPERTAYEDSLHRPTIAVDLNPGDLFILVDAMEKLQALAPHRRQAETLEKLRRAKTAAYEREGIRQWVT